MYPVIINSLLLKGLFSLILFSFLVINEEKMSNVAKTEFRNSKTTPRFNEAFQAEQHMLIANYKINFWINFLGRI